MSVAPAKLPPHYADWGTQQHVHAQALLRDVPLLREVPAHHLREVARTARRVTFRAGETVIRAGEFGATLYVIRAGRVDVVRDTGGDARVVLASLGPGEFFGELSLLDTGPRSATVVATELTEAVVLDHDAILRLVQRHPEVAMALLRPLSTRLRMANNRLEDATRAGRPAVPFERP